MNEIPAPQPETLDSPTSLLDVPGGPVPDPAPAPPAEAAGEPPAPEGEGSLAAPEVAPLTFESLTLPEGLSLSPELGAKFVDALNNAELDPQGRANALLSLHAEVLKEAADAYAGQWEAMQNEWKQGVLTAFPGEKLTQAQTQIAKVLDRYGDKAVREAFALTGAGNNPDIFKFLAAVAADMNEQPPVRGAPAAAPPSDRASRMFKTQE